MTLRPNYDRLAEVILQGDIVVSIGGSPLGRGQFETNQGGYFKMLTNLNLRSGLARVIGYIAILWIAGFLVAGHAYGQAVAQVSGVVKDETGAAAPGTTITATQTETGVKRSVTSDDGGNYVLTNLPLGPYRLEATKMGFRTYVQTGIELQVGSAPEIPIRLAVGQVSESVNVEANASQVETRAVGVGTVIESQRIVELPLNGRQPTDLITLSGSAVFFSNSAGYGMRTGVLISVAGGSYEGVQYNYDGAPHINTLDASNMPLPFPDALQEFKVTTSAQDASAVGHSAASVNAVTKSGTNAFHGDAFEFLRNYSANARDFFASKPDGLKRNQFGGTFGGPLKKDKLFFFAGYQGSLLRQQIVQSPASIPTLDMLKGDFTTFESAACQGTNKTLGAPFVNNVVANPSAVFSPAAVKISTLLLNGGSTFKALTPNACGIVPWTLPNNENDHQIPVRVDYQLNDRHTLFARYLLTKQKLAIPLAVGGSPLTEGTPGFDDQAQNFTLGETFTINANQVNSARLFINRIRSLKQNVPLFGEGDVGINSYTYLPSYLYVIVTGGFTMGSTTKNAFSYVTDYGVSDDYSIVHGSHLFGFGGYYMNSINWLLAQAYAGANYNFSGGLSGFLLGQVSQMRQESPNPLNVRQSFFSAYAKDTWKVNQHLTVNYGLTWVPFWAASFPQGDSYIFNLSNFYAGTHSTAIPGAPAGFLYPGDNGFNGNSGIQARWGNLDPRVGIAWDPKGDGKTVLRFGAGIGHDFASQNLLINNEASPPFRALIVVPGTLSLDNPWANYPGGDPYPFTFSKTKPTFPAYSGYLPVPSNWKTGVQYSWNAVFQRQINANWFASVTYLGTHILHVVSAAEINPAQYIPGTCAAGQYGLTAAGPCSSSANINQRRVLNLASPGTQLGYMTQYDDGSTQNYNGLQLATTWRMQSNLSLNANYTWSKCIGLVLVNLLNPGQNYIHSGYGNTMPGANNRNADMGPCSQDRRQNANVTLVAQSPKFANKYAHMIGTGWTLSTTIVARSGGPFQVVTGVNPDPASGAGGNSSSQRPNQLLPDVYSTAQGSPGPASAGAYSIQWLNPAAFGTVPIGTYGNMGAMSVFGPSFWEWDEALSRQFSIHDKQKFEIRVEAFNLTNSLRPGNPNLTLSTAANFGQITTDATPPAATTAPARVMQFAMKYTF